MTAPSDFVLSDDKSRLDLELISKWLGTSSYWAKGRPFAVVARSVQHSLCIGAYDANGAQIGFARVVTDYATFAWLCDVFVVEEARGRGVGKRLVEAVVAHRKLGGLRRFLLATRDAHTLYQRHGNFKPLALPDRWMEKTAKS